MAQEGDPRQIKEEVLLALINRTGFTIIQENGQRKYGGPPPGWIGPSPPKGCEIFIGKIPRDLFEDELVPVFERIGPIYEMRLMMDFSGSNRGYGFVMYTSSEDAQRAIQELNNYEIRRHRYLGVVKSVDNCRLFVGGIPKSKTREEILDEMQKVTEGVVNVILYSSVSDKNRNRGFAFVEYDSHRAAAMARRKLIPGKVLLWGQEVAVDWAEPEPDVDDVTMSKVTVLYVRNLFLATSEEHLCEIFNEASEHGVEKVKKLRDFAFVHFASRVQAQMAKEALHGTEIDGSVVDVTWAKPVDKKQYKLQKQLAKAVSCDASVGMSSTSLASFTSSSPPFARASGFEYNYGVLSPNVLVRSIRGRGRGAAGIRGGRTLDLIARGNVRRGPDIRRYNLNPTLVSLMGMPLALSPVMNPYSSSYRYPLLLTPNKHAPQMLADICRQYGFGDPEYQLLSNVAQPPNEQEEKGRLYVYKVTIPTQGPPFVLQPRTFADTPNEAKVIAAEYALMQLGFTSEALAPIGSDTSIASPRPSPTVSAEGSDDTVHSVAPLPLARPLPLQTANMHSSSVSRDYYAMTNQFAQLGLAQPMFIESSRMMEHGFYENPTMGLAGLPTNRIY